jgi:CheY-like chemotaxis protein
MFIDDLILCAFLSSTLCKKEKEVNILIAEDNQIIQMLLTELMSNWGYDFDMASNGIEAVEFAQKNNGKYDFCLMDVEMPKMNGIEATKIIRKTTTYFPIMAYTAKANNDYKKACFEAGMDDFALKPYLPDDLFAKINKLSACRYRLESQP